MIFNTIETVCIREKLISPGQTIIIGLSGGPDSVFLLYFLLSIQKKYSLKLIAAHLDHGWRTESAREAAWCQELCTGLGISFYSAHMRDIDLAKGSSGSAEDNARRARRAFFEDLVDKKQADNIALAHHQDDLIETFFIRLVRGSGLTGLTSIKAQQGIYIRPLLETPKTTILNYLQENAIPYCVDMSNNDTSFLRNAIRHKLLPVYDTVDARATHNLVRTIEQLQEADRFIEKISQEQYTTIVQDCWLDCVSFFTLDAVVQHRILLAWIIQAGVPFTPSEKFFAEIIRFLQQPASKKHQITLIWSIEKVKRKARIIHKPT